MKRAAAKQLIERYYYQLTDGCGNTQCTNEFCASSGHQVNLSRNDAAALALDLFTKHSRLCEMQPNKQQRKACTASASVRDSQESVGRKSTPGPDTCTTSTGKPSASGVSFASTQLPTHSTTKRKDQKPPLHHLTLCALHEMIQKCQEGGEFSALVRAIGWAFSSPENLNGCFLKDHSANPSNKSPGEGAMAEGSADDDGEIDVDLVAVQEAYSSLSACNEPSIENAFLNALGCLAPVAVLDVIVKGKNQTNPGRYLNQFVTIMENPSLHYPDYLDTALPYFCKAMAFLSVRDQSKLARFWSHLSPGRLRHKVETLQQLITFKVISGDYLSPGQYLDRDDSICNATRCLRIFYYSAILGGATDCSDEDSERESDLIQFYESMGLDSKTRRPQERDDMSKILNVRPLDARRPLIPLDDFVNLPLNEALEMDRDYKHYRSDRESDFSFLSYSFVLTTASKSHGLYYDHRVRMHNERTLNMMISLVHGQPVLPYMRLKVRRDHLIEDSLVRLEMIAMENPADLKKQLVVEFEGEQGIDEGGVSKEFFQLVVEEIFNPDFGMFIYDETTRLYWFNPTSFETDGQFTLIGIVLGLAIYNGIILDIHFPMVVYRKLMGKRGILEDLTDSHPTVARSLKDVLVYDGDVDTDIGMTYRVSYTDVFGSTISHDLKDGGENIHVTNENRKEFVDMYADFLLNKSISRQFAAFRRGFHMVTDESPLAMWFIPEEIELLVCGSKDFDFDALENSTEYDGGYSRLSDQIRWFWQVVHELPLDHKKQLLVFTTGSDRVPVGGLAKLKMIVSKNGPDSDRLPTAHTCFNVLMLPEYSTAEKLKNRLCVAIMNAKGFGML